METIIEVSKIIEKNMAILDRDAKKIFENICTSMRDEDKLVKVSFDGIKFISITFLEYIMGKLYNIFPADVIKSRLKMEDLSLENEQLLAKVTKRAKKNAVPPSKILKSLENT